jgi:hypothetical protein
VTPDPVGIASTRRLAAVPTVVRPFTRPRRSKTILEPESVGCERTSTDSWRSVASPLWMFAGGERDREGLASHLGDPPCASGRRLQIA